MFTNEMKGILKMFFSAFIISMTIAGIYFAFTFESKMEQVRQETIEEAVLVSSDESGYTISFGGKLHSYTFD